MEEIEAINGFTLFKNNLKIEHFVGFLSRKSYAIIKYKNNNEMELMDNEKTNKLFMSWILNNFGVNSEQYRILNNYKEKIEDLSKHKHILDSGKKIIGDYCDYRSSQNLEIYDIMPQMSLIKLEQFLIQNEISTCFIEELSKSNTQSIYKYKNAFNWISTITKFKVENVIFLKEYLDYYFEYLLEKPKPILKINELSLPISILDRNKIDTVRQYAGYLSRNSTVTVKEIISSQSIDNELANYSFITWFTSIYGKNCEKSLELENIKYQIEHPSDLIIKSEKELIKNDTNAWFKFNSTNSTEIEKQNYLILLEQYLIRYKLPPEYVVDYKNTYDPAYVNNDKVMDWISKIINKDKGKINALKDYLALYFNHIFINLKSE